MTQLSERQFHGSAKIFMLVAALRQSVRNDEHLPGDNGRTAQMAPINCMSCGTAPTDYLHNDENRIDGARIPKFCLTCAVNFLSYMIGVAHRMPAGASIDWNRGQP